MCDLRLTLNNLSHHAFSGIPWKINPPVFWSLSLFNKFIPTTPEKNQLSYNLQVLTYLLIIYLHYFVGPKYIETWPYFLLAMDDKVFLGHAFIDKQSFESFLFFLAFYVADGHLNSNWQYLEKLSWLYLYHLSLFVLILSPNQLFSLETISQWEGGEKFFPFFLEQGSLFSRGSIMARLCLSHPFNVRAYLVIADKSPCDCIAACNNFFRIKFWISLPPGCPHSFVCFHANVLEGKLAVYSDFMTWPWSHIFLQFYPNFNPHTFFLTKLFCIGFGWQTLVSFVPRYFVLVLLLSCVL